MTVKMTISAGRPVANRTPRPHARARRAARPASGNILKIRVLFAASHPRLALGKIRKRQIKSNLTN